MSIIFSIWHKGQVLLFSFFYHLESYFDTSLPNIWIQRGVKVGFKMININIYHLEPYFDTGLAPGSIWMGSMDPWKVWNLGFKGAKSILRGPSGVHSCFPLNSCCSLTNPLVCPDYSSPSEWLFLNDFIDLACFAACGNMACHVQRTVFGYDLPCKIQIIVIIREVPVNASKRKRKKMGRNSSL